MQITWTPRLINVCRHYQGGDANFEVSIDGYKLRFANLLTFYQRDFHNDVKAKPKMKPKPKQQLELF